MPDLAICCRICSRLYFRFPGDGDRHGHLVNDDLTTSGSYNNINRIGLGGYGLGGYGGGIGLGQQIRVSEIRQVELLMLSSRVSQPSLYSVTSSWGT